MCDPAVTPSPVPPPQPEPVPASPPGPDDVVTVKVGGKAGDIAGIAVIARGAASDSHPMGTGLPVAAV